VFKEIHPSFKEKGMKLPEEILSREEVARLMNVARSLRDKTLIAVLYESGARIGEIITLQVRHVSFDEHGAVLIVNGKTGMRRVRLVESAKLLESYVNSLPRTVDCPLWLGAKGEAICYRMAYKIVKELMRECRIGKNVYPHLFRHSRATHLAKNLNEQQLRVHFGWSGRSDVPSVYVHLTGRDVEEAILELYEKKPVKESSDLDEFLEFYTSWRKMKSV